VTQTTTDKVRDVAERAHGSDGVERLARVGLAARTLVWFVLGGLVVRLALGQSGGQPADQSGALKSLAGTPLGGALLVALALGFLVWALYRLLCAAVGSRDVTDRKKRWAHRGKAAAEGLLYLIATATAVRVLVTGRSDSEEQADSVTAAVMGVTGGRTLIGLAGLGLVLVAAALAWRAVRRQHADKLEHFRVPRSLRRPAVTVGVVGLIGRSAVVALIGAFLVNAAVRFDADEAKGLDGSLRAVAEQPFGQALLGLAAVGVLGYALWSLVETLWRDL
jgi:hypothetical protein